MPRASTKNAPTGRNTASRGRSSWDESGDGGQSENDPQRLRWCILDGGETGSITKGLSGLRSVDHRYRVKNIDANIFDGMVASASNDNSVMELAIAA